MNVYKTIAIQVFLLLFCDLFCQEFSTTKTFREYADSIESEILLSNGGDISELKHFRRWQRLMSTRVGQNNSIAPFVEKRSNYLRTNNSRVLKSSNVDNIQWNYFGPKGVPTHPGSTGTSYSTGKGWINSLIVDETNPDNIAAGAHHSGLWKTTNHGDSWEAKSNNAGEIFGIISMIQDGQDIIVSSHIAGGTEAYTMGVYLSENGGDSWNDINNGDLDIYPEKGYREVPRKLYRNPYDSDQIFYVTYSSVYKSINNGADWERIFNHTSPWGDKSVGLFDIEIVRNVTGNETIYLSGSKIYKSIDLGDTFYDITDTITGEAGLTNVSAVDRTEMATNTIYNDKVWFNFTYNKILYLVKFDGNTTYDDLGSQPFYYDPYYGKNKQECEISPNDEDKIYIAGLEIWLVDGPTQDWDKISNCSKTISASQILDGTNWVHADVRDLKIIDNSGTDRIYVAHDGGVSWGEWDSSLGIYNFRQISYDDDLDGEDGLNVTEFHGFDVADNVNDFIVGGCQDLSVFAFNSPAGPSSWIHSAAGDGASTVIDDIDNKYVYVFDFLNNRLSISSNGAEDFSRKILYNMYASQIALDPNNFETLYAGSLGVIKKYTNIKTTWNTEPDLIPPSINASYITAIAIDPNNTNILYTASDHLCMTGSTSNIMWKYDQSTSTWTSLSQNFLESSGGSPFEYTFITDIEINPNNSSEIWACFGLAKNGQDKVFHTTNGGTSWEPLYEGYPSDMPANNLSYDYASDLIYVSTDVGIFYYDVNDGWTKFGTGLPDVLITDMDINNISGTMFVATHGRGIWSAELPEENCYNPEGDIEISSNTTWSTDDIKCGNIYIIDGATLTITADIIQNPRYEFIVEVGSELIINGGSLKIGAFLIEQQGQMSITNGGELLLNVGL